MLPNPLDWTFYVTWINLLLMKHKSINFDWIVNTLVVHNLLINYLNLKKSQYRSSCSPLFCSCKNFAMFRVKHLCWSLLLIKLQVCNFPVNIAKCFKNSFFHKTPPVAASEKFINFSGKRQWRRLLDLSF